MIGHDRITRRQRLLRAAVLLAVAVLVFAVLPGCASAPQASAAPPAADLGAVVASAGPDGTGATVTLHAGRGPCDAPALAAVWTADGRPTVRGCWILLRQAGVEWVQVSFLDGERGDIPISHLRRPEES